MHVSFLKVFSTCFLARLCFFVFGLRRGLQMGCHQLASVSIVVVAGEVAETQDLQLQLQVGPHAVSIAECFELASIR